MVHYALGHCSRTDGLAQKAIAILRNPSAMQVRRLSAEARTILLEC
ncbi:hypothetical protein [Synechococcus sp. PCC 7336]|nr:hypothetical protein [Synechococcus sp. PCC 7336]